MHSWELVTAVDGPGTRLTVFLAGCPLRCLYCHNPDTLTTRNGQLTDATEVLDRVRRYRKVFAATGGGLTLSGGEVLQQPAFAERILRGAREMGVHTALDTSGFLGARASESMLDDTDLVLLDVKAGDSQTYRHVTGRELAPTLEFGRRLARRGLASSEAGGRGAGLGAAGSREVGGRRGAGSPTEVWIRYVLVPGLTDSRESVEGVAAYAASLNEIRPGTVRRVEVLPFHQMGRDKWAALGMRYELADTEPPSAAATEAVRDVFRGHGLVTY